MPEEAGSTEPSSFQRLGKDQGFLHQHTTAVATFASAYLVAIIVAMVFAHMWEEEEFRLHILNTIIKLLQTIARVFGSWALECERAYNEYLNTLH
jgi:heme/copper-type cytochrome/quinol oxidase subunit 4